jgi:DNA-binding SARP family transcriptional activator
LDSGVDHFDRSSSADAPLEIFLFGEPRITRRGFEASPFPTRKARSIFALLVLGRQKAHFRDELADCFWPESTPGRSRAALRSELWRVRLTLSRYGVNPLHFLEVKQETIRFRPTVPCSVDVELFDRAVAAGGGRIAPADPAGALPEAAVLDLYRADLLAGEYGDWCQHYREHYRARFLSSLETLMEDAIGRRDFRHAVELGDRLLAEDPLAEHVHRTLMACHAARGNRPAALRQYRRCESILEQELNVGPMPETRALFDEIRARSHAAGGARESAAADAALRVARLALSEATQRLDWAILMRG